MPIPPGRHMTEEAIHAAALRDPDNPPRSADQLARLRSRPRVFIIRRAMKLTQVEFAEQFQIPIGTLRDWEQGRVEPDQAAKAYLKVITHNPTLVLEALQAGPKRPPIATAAEPKAAE
jgi:putative transcriptional regulator